MTGPGPESPLVQGHIWSPPSKLIHSSIRSLVHALHSKKEREVEKATSFLHFSPLVSINVPSSLPGLLDPSISVKVVEVAKKYDEPEVSLSS